MAVALPFGGTLALTVMSTVFNNTSGIATTSPLRDVSALQSLPPDVLARVVENAKVTRARRHRASVTDREGRWASSGHTSPSCRSWSS